MKSIKLASFVFTLICAKFLFSVCFAEQIRVEFLTSRNESVRDPRLNISVHVITWNVHNEDPKIDVKQLLTSSLGQNDVLPDIYAVGLQEIPYRLFGTNPWKRSIRNLLYSWGYAKIRTIRMQQMSLLLYAKRSFVSLVHDSKEESTGTGFGGFWGNKGGVSVKFNYNGTRFCFVNSHLAAHQENLDQRVSEYQEITRDQRVLENDIILWFGDLNFRLDNVTSEQVLAQVRDSKYNQLLTYDQLKRVQQERRAFVEYQEPEINFAPTYKFVPQSNDYDGTRTPAWPDRVLYHLNPRVEFKELEYNSVPSFTLSDHKPVRALFRVIMY